VGKEWEMTQPRKGRKNDLHTGFVGTGTTDDKNRIGAPGKNGGKIAREYRVGISYYEDSQRQKLENRRGLRPKREYSIQIFFAHFAAFLRDLGGSKLLTAKPAKTRP
jgi:hypothetical protein